MAQTLESLAATLDADPEFHKLSQQEQDQSFAELAKDIPQSASTAQPVEAPGFQATTIGAPTPPTAQTFFPASIGLQQASAQHPIAANLPFMRAGAAGMDVLRNVGAVSGLPREMIQRGQFDPVGAYLTNLRGGRLQNSPEEAGMAQLTDALAGYGMGQIPLGKMATAATKAIEEVPLDKAFRLFNRTPRGKLLNDTEFEALAGKVRQAVGGGKLAAGIEFDQGITSAVNAKPDVATPIGDFLETLKTEMKANPTYAEKIQQGMYRSAKQGNTTLQGMLTDESRAFQATGRDVQNIKQTIQSVPSIDRALQRTYATSQKLGRFDASVSDADLALIDHLSDLRGRLLSTYPELHQEYATYANFMNDYRTIAPRLRTGSLETTLLEKYGGAMQRQAASRVFPSEILQQVEQVRTDHRLALEQIRKTKDFHKLLKKLGYAAAAGTVGGLGFEEARKFIPH